MHHFMGIDVSADHLDVAIVDCDGKLVRPAARYENSWQGAAKILEEAPDPAGLLVVFESTGVYGKILGVSLMGRVAKACEVNPKIIKNAATSMTRTKTDELDALAIAQTGAALHKTRPEVLENAAISEDQNPDLDLWLGEYDRLRRAICRLKLQRDAMKRHPADVATVLVGRMNEELAILEASKKTAMSQIEEFATGEDIELVESIPGIGKLTAAALCNKIQRIERFAGADQLKAYIGWYPTTRESGKRRGRSSIAKHGDKLVRHCLWNCAKVASRHNPHCKALYERLTAQGKPPAYAWAAVARKLLQITYGVLTNRTRYNPTQGLTRNG